MRLRFLKRPSYELYSPLSIGECRLRLACAQVLLVCDVVRMPGKRGAVRATTLFIEDQPPGDVDAAFSGTMTPTETGTFISLRDETSRLEYESSVFAFSVASVAAYASLAEGTRDLKSIILLTLMYAMIAGFTLRMFTRKRKSGRQLVEAIRELLEIPTPLSPRSVAKQWERGRG